RRRLCGVPGLHHRPARLALSRRRGRRPGARRPPRTKQPRGAHMAYVEWRGNTCRVVWNTRQKDERGKWIYDQKGGFTDEAAAKTYGLDREAEIRNDDYISSRDGSVTVGEYAKTWVD